jgi:hypothetical protein
MVFPRRWRCYAPHFALGSSAHAFFLRKAWPWFNHRALEIANTFTHQATWFLTAFAFLFGGLCCRNATTAMNGVIGFVGVVLWDLGAIESHAHLLAALLASTALSLFAFGRLMRRRLAQTSGSEASG